MNKAGIKPLEFNILIEVDSASSEHVFVDPASGREFKIHKPDELVDREQVSATTGTVLEVSDTAFTFEDGAERVEPGDRIAFARFAGMRVKGADQGDYLILKDKDVAAVYREVTA